MNPKSLAYKCFWLVLVIMLSACKETLQDKTSVPSTQTQSPTLLPVIGITPPTPLFTPTLQPTSLPTVTLDPLFPSPLPALTSTPTSTPFIFPPTLPALPTQPLHLPEFPLDNYIVVFEKEENLYYQDGEEAPVKITDWNVSGNVVISDDNQKIAFLRKGDNNVYFVNSDGSNEYTYSANWILTGSVHPSQQKIVFIPYSHLLLNSNLYCETEETTGSCISALALIDTDTNKVTQLISADQQVRFSYKISPNGKNISILYSGHIDIIDINGNIVRKNVLPYTPSAPVELFPEYYWLPDSSGLIVAIPNTTKFGWAFPANPSYSVWIYKIGSNSSRKLILSPSPELVFVDSGNIIDPSTDGHWMLYRSSEQYTWVRYLVNLETGKVEPYTEWIESGVSWSADSKHFLFADRYLGSVDKSYSQLRGIFMNWIDESHYAYVIVEKDVPKLYIAEISGDTILYYKYPNNILLIKPKK